MSIEIENIEEECPKPKCIVIGVGDSEMQAARLALEHAGHDAITISDHPHDLDEDEHVDNHGIKDVLRRRHLGTIGHVMSSTIASALKEQIEDLEMISRPRMRQHEEYLVYERIPEPIDNGFYGDDGRRKYRAGNNSKRVNNSKKKKKAAKQARKQNRKKK